MPTRPRRQLVRFCSSLDGTRIAYAITGNGPALVKAPHWLTHLEYEFASPLWQPWIAALSRSYRLLRMDVRGCGLSDRDVEDISFEAYCRDLEAVVDAAGYSAPFALLGHSQGAAIAVAYAAQHPARVSHLVLLGGYARGVRRRNLPPDALAEYDALLKLVHMGWGREDATYRQMFSMQFIPGATLAQIRYMSELQRAASSAENATRILRSFYSIDITELAPRVQAPTLVLHARGDRRVPFEEGRLLASMIPRSVFVPLETANHILLEDEPAFDTFFETLSDFVPGAAGAPAGALADLTQRESDILERIAQGLDNGDIAAQLGLAPKTVRNHITRIFDKLGVHTRSQAIVLAREHGLGAR